MDDIIILLRFIVFTPIATLIIMIGLYYWLQHKFQLKTSLSDCMGCCFKWGAVAAGASLIIFILWMGWSTITSKADLGQAPLVWIFGIGPISFMIGTIVGFIVWQINTRKQNIS